MAKTWRSRAGISTLTDLAYRRRALKPLVIDTALPYWQRATIKRAITYLRGLIKHPKPGLPLAKRIDSLAQELDYLQELAAARNAHRHRLGQRGFRGNVNHLNLLLASLDSPISENEWNHWRQSRPRIVPDLRGAHLEKLDPIDTSLYPRHRPGVSLTVENLEVAHFLSLVRSKRDRLADIINTASRHIVLLLGRFTGPGADVLALLRDALPPAGYAPIVFDFAVPDDRDLVETVATLAGLARFVIADLSQPRSTPLEAQLIIPNIAIPYVPIIRRGERPVSMFMSLQRKFGWVLPTVTYSNEQDLARKLSRQVIAPAEKMARWLRSVKHS